MEYFLAQKSNYVPSFFSFLIFECTIRTRICTYVCEWMWKPEIDVQCLLPLFFVYLLIFEQIIHVYVQMCVHDCGSHVHILILCLFIIFVWGIHVYVHMYLASQRSVFNVFNYFPPHFWQSFSLNIDLNFIFFLFPLYWKQILLSHKFSWLRLPSLNSTQFFPFNLYPTSCCFSLENKQVVSNVNNIKEKLAHWTRQSKQTNQRKRVHEMAKETYIDTENPSFVHSRILQKNPN